jgi:signal transduction histidine kinase/ligand-binding sensor domain-containing protein
MKKLILIILLAGSSLFAFSQQIIFNAVPFSPDKSVRAFTGIAQDHLGYIWLSSYRAGLYRYDGTEFINYEHNDSNSNSIAGDWDECIWIDSLNIIWIGTFGEGLDRFDPVTKSFTHFRHDPKNETSLANDTVTAIFEDHLGNLWVGNSSGLDLLNEKKGTFIHYSYKKGDPTGLASPQVRAIYEDHQGTLWVGCGSPFVRDDQNLNSGGLNRFNRKKGTFTQYRHDPSNPNSLASNKVRALFEDSKGNFWVGTSGNGLHIMDRDRGTFTHYYYDSLHPENLSRPPLLKNQDDHITFIREDVKGGIWIGSFYNGINRLDPITNKITHFGDIVNYNGDAFVRQDTVSGYDDFRSWQALFTTDGMIWISIFNSNKGNLLFKATVNKKSIPYTATKGQGAANSFYLDSDSTLWIATDSGLLKKNLLTHTERLYTHKARNPASKTESTINAIRVDRQKNIWCGSFGGGLIRFDSTTNSFIEYRNNRTIKSSLINDTIFVLYLDHQDGLWIGTQNGLDKMDKKNGQFTHFELKTAADNITGRTINCIREDKDHVLWVATSDGLFRIDISTGKLIAERIRGVTESICVDSKNNVWIGSDTNGARTQYLYRFDRNNSKLLSYKDPGSGRRIRDILDIIEDRNKSIWITTKDAIFKINDKRDLLRKYGTDYGVHQNTFLYGDNFVANNGRLFFGDQGGYYSFFPEEMDDDSRPLLNFTSLQVNGSEVFPSDQSILKQPLWKTDEINLSYSQNIFSLEFIGINYQAIGEIKYLFKLEGYDESWHKYGSDHRAYYYNVPPGKYTFLIKAFNAAGGSSEKSLRIIISPPWWKTWWAYSLFGIFLIGTIWAFLNYRSRKLRSENLILEQKVTLRTNQLNQSLEELKSTQAQLVQSEKMASLGELTAGIAHEIQNPLNFMNNFSEVNKELLVEMKDEMDKGNINEVRSLADNVILNEEKISHHGRRADAIVKGMLQHSRSSSSVKEPTDINALVDEYLRLSFHGLRARDKSFNSAMKTDYDQKVGIANIIPQDIGRVLLNIFNNAFYAVSEKERQNSKGFEPTVTVSTRKTGNWVEIRVRDNGNGIPQKVIDKIFQPFFTTKPTGQGTGLGLSLSYDIIKAHGGEIKVNTKEWEYSEFVIKISEL